MANQKVTLLKPARIKNKKYPKGEVVSVDDVIYADLLALGAIAKPAAATDNTKQGE